MCDTSLYVREGYQMSPLLVNSCVKDRSLKLEKEDNCPRNRIYQHEEILQGLFSPGSVRSIPPPGMAVQLLRAL